MPTVPSPVCQKKQNVPGFLTQCIPLLKDLPRSQTERPHVHFLALAPPPPSACLSLWLAKNKSDNLLVCLDQGQELVLGGAHQLPDLLPVLVHLKGGHGRDARRGRHILVLVHVDLVE